MSEKADRASEETEQVKVLRLQVPQEPGVFAEEVNVLLSDDHILLAFIQVYDMNDKNDEARGQIAAHVYMTIKKAKVFHRRLGEVLGRRSGDEKPER